VRGSMRIDPDAQPQRFWFGCRRVLRHPTGILRATSRGHSNRPLSKRTTYQRTTINGRGYNPAADLARAVAPHTVRQAARNGEAYPQARPRRDGIRDWISESAARSGDDLKRVFALPTRAV